MNDRSRAVPLAFLGALLIAGGTIYFANSLRPDNGTTDGQVAAAVTSTTEEEAKFNPLPTTTTEVPTTTEAPTTTTEPPPGECDPDNTRSGRLAGGILYLEGEIPTRAIGDEIVAKAAAVVGEENVVDNYEVVEGAPLPNCASVNVEDRVLFASNSSELSGDYEPLLRLGVALMTQNPEVQIAIVAHTDWVETDAYNQALSERRAQAIYDYWVEAGIDPDRLTAIGRGETEPTESDETSAGKQANRRAEFHIRGLLAL